MATVHGRVSLPEEIETAFLAHCLLNGHFGGLTVWFLVQEEGGEASSDEGSPDMADTVMLALKRCGAHCESNPLAPRWLLLIAPCSLSIALRQPMIATRNAKWMRWASQRRIMPFSAHLKVFVVLIGVFASLAGFAILSAVVFGKRILIQAAMMCCASECCH